MNKEWSLETEWVRMDLLAEDDRIEILDRAGRIIREGGLVAFPTETVYGLGADAMNARAAARIYEAKGRPSDNPLIVHIADFAEAEKLSADISPGVWRIFEACWPSPLTVILPKRPEVPDGTTGGLSTVAIRMPSHPLAAELIRRSGRMIAAPSANLSGRPSPTTAAHVYEDMKGRIPMILDGGPVRIGIESTILDMTGEEPVILRPGFISPGDLGKVWGGRILLDPAVASRTMKKNIKARAPGMKYRHYAPKGKMVLVEGPSAAVAAAINALAAADRKEGLRVGIIGTEETAGLYRGDVVRALGSRQHPETIAAALYRILREMDDLNCSSIYSESFYDEELGEAIMNRLMKAAGCHVIKVRQGMGEESFVIEDSKTEGGPV